MLESRCAFRSVYCIDHKFRPIAPFTFFVSLSTLLFTSLPFFTMSQFSDILSSSVYEDDLTDNLPFFVPDDTQHPTPTPSTSQPTINPKFARHQPKEPPPLIPNTLTRVGPGRGKSWVLYSEMLSKDFVHWWLKTDYGNAKRINWDGKRQAECWKHFEQVADCQTGRPGAMCKECSSVLDHPAHGHTGTSSLNKHMNGVSCRRAIGKKPSIKRLMEQAVSESYSRASLLTLKLTDLFKLKAQRTPTRVFSQEVWEQNLLKLLTVSRLPFQFIEHPEFHDVISFARLASQSPTIPSSKTIRARLRALVCEQQQSLLQKLPPDAKISIALDCWTSPFRQAFMAVTGYFLDIDWEYQEILLGFEPLSGSHSGANLSDVLLKLFQQHQITDRVLAVTTDNASNNDTMMTSIQESIQALELNDRSTIIRVLYRACYST